MRRALTFLVAITALGFGINNVGADDGDSDKTIRVLVTYGGHGFEEAPFWAMFDAMDGIEYDKAEFPKDFDKLAPGLEKGYDVIVRYDMTRGIPKEQCEAFVELLKERGIGLVSWHHNLGAHRDWPEYRNIIGGAYVFDPFEAEGKAWEKSTFAHWKRTDFARTDVNHPITKDIPTMAILGNGETYGKCYVAKDVKVLMTTNQERTTPEQVWVKQYGKSPVCHVMPGHGGDAYSTPEFQQLLKQAIEWAAK